MNFNPMIDYQRNQLLAQQAMIQNQLNQINQLQLQNALAGVVRYPNAWTYNAGVSPFCGCNNGCGC